MGTGIEVKVPPPQPERRQRVRLTPTGWVTLITVLVFVGSGLAYVTKTVYDRTRSLEQSLHPIEYRTPTPTSSVVLPTRTAYPAASFATRPPTAVPPTGTPQGWRELGDPSGNGYLSPPPEVEAQIREAFEAVTACEFIEDVPDEVAMQYDREATLDSAAQHTTPEMIDYYRQRNIVGLYPLGPENPVRCSDYTTCKLARAKLGSNGGIIYDADGCTMNGLEFPCIIRDMYDESPYAIYIGTIELRDGRWIVTSIIFEKLPEPPQP